MSQYRYKKNKKRKKGDNPHFLREKEINRKINYFCKLYNEADLQDKNIYYEMNKLRLDIKSLFNKQEDDLFYQSHNRKRIYFEQLARFKRVYTSWKNNTYGIFLYTIDKIPEHLICSIQNFKKEKLISRYMI